MLIVDVFLVGSSVMLGESSGCIYQTYSHKSREIDTHSTFEFGHGRTVERRASASIGRRSSRAPLLPPNVFTGAQSGANCGISVPAVCVRRYPSQTGSRPSPIFSSVSTIRRRLEVVIPSDRHFSLPAPVLSPRSCASLGIAWSLHTSRLAASFSPRPPRRKRPCGDRWLCGRQRSLPCRHAPVRCPAPAHTGRQRRLSPTGSIVNFSQTLQCPS